jgi:hypothetical protein
MLEALALLLLMGRKGKHLKVIVSNLAPVTPADYSMERCVELLEENHEGCMRLFQISQGAPVKRKRKPKILPA